MAFLPQRALQFLDEEKFNALKYAKSTKDLHDAHPFFKVASKELSKIAKELAWLDDRRAAKIQLHYDSRSLYDMFAVSADMLPPELRDKQGFNQRDTWYDPVRNRINIAMQPMNTGLQVLSKLYHEDEHARQRAGCGYDPDQQKMIAIARALYDKDNVNHLFYRNNYIELYARLAEAKMLVAACTFCAPTDVSEKHPMWRDDILRVYKNMHTELTQDVSRENMQILNEENQHREVPPERLKILYRAFPEYKTPESVVQAAHDFLAQKGMMLYQRVYDDTQAWDSIICALHRRLTADKAVFEAAQALVQKQAEWDDIIKQYNVPTISSIPEGVQVRPISENPNITALCKLNDEMLYNVAFCRHPAHGYCLVFDNNKIPRPYSTNPTLRAQWEAEHPEEQDADVKIYTRDVDEPR